MASSDMRVAISLRYLQALTTIIGLNSSEQEYTLSGRRGTGGCSLAKEHFSVQKLWSEASAVHVQFSRKLEGSLKVVVPFLYLFSLQEQPQVLDGNLSFFGF